MNAQQLIFGADDMVARPLSFAQGSVEELASSTWKGSVILGRAAAHEGFFTDYSRGCGGECEGFCRDLSEGCARAKAAVAATLMRPGTMVWEVWRRTGPASVDLVGILRLSDIVVGCDAKAHYFFFDGKLRDKTQLLAAWKKWVFSEHDGWPAMHRITIDVPLHAFALARHAQRHLGFGGPYEYRCRGTRLAVEGVRQGAVLWRGQWHDILTMGCIDGVRSDQLGWSGGPALAAAHGAAGAADR